MRTRVHVLHARLICWGLEGKGWENEAVVGSLFLGSESHNRGKDVPHRGKDVWASMSVFTPRGTYFLLPSFGTRRVKEAALTSDCGPTIISGHHSPVM